MAQLAQRRNSSSTFSREAGRSLKRLRERLCLTTREVEKASQAIADLENNLEFFISNARLTQIENDGSMPSIYKMYTLATIYRLSMEEVLRRYGVDHRKMDRHRQLKPYGKTHVLSTEVPALDRLIYFPVRFDPGFRPEKTVFLSRLVQTWKEIPVGLLLGLDLRQHIYGYIGLNDRTMYPLIRPGCVVQIDPHQKRVQNGGWNNEFERPIYFLELRYGYECGWCHQAGKELTLLPHPLSGLPPKLVRVPDEGEIIGQITGVAMRFNGQSPS